MHANQEIGVPGREPALSGNAFSSRRALLPIRRLAFPGGGAGVPGRAPRRYQKQGASYLPPDRIYWNGPIKSGDNIVSLRPVTMFPTPAVRTGAIRIFP